MRVAVPYISGAFHTSKYRPFLRHHALLLAYRDGCNRRGWSASPVWPQYQSRGAKSKSTIRIRDLPQGMLDGGLSAQEGPSDDPVYPTVIQQAKMNMRKFENCVVLTRMGGFYEVRWQRSK